jgi:hypothetical protein
MLQNDVLIIGAGQTAWRRRFAGDLPSRPIQCLFHRRNFFKFCRFLDNGRCQEFARRLWFNAVQNVVPQVVTANADDR